MADSLRLLVDRLRTPIGELVVVSDEKARVRAIDWQDHEDRMLRKLTIHYGARGWSLTRTGDPFGHTAALAAYMDGNVAALDTLEVETGGTAFQRQVWRALREIPTGTTTSYGELAKRIGRPSAVRAVGLANGANPIGIVVPCHRVIGANGSLTGYAGGLQRKRWLIAHEARHVVRPPWRLRATEEART
jgi:methylated-DNA-[protein]-cysteine S-methyltransferase